MNGTKEKKAVWLKRFLNIGGMVAVTALLTWTYFCNPIDKKNYLFGDFEAVSEALVVGPILSWQYRGYFFLLDGYLEPVSWKDGVSDGRSV